MRLAMFQILGALSRGPAEAADLRDRIRNGGSEADLPSIPTFYRHLKSAIDVGWIEIRDAPSPERGRGRPRRLYALSRSGRTALRHRAIWLRELTRPILEGNRR